MGGGGFPGQSPYGREPEVPGHVVQPLLPPEASGGLNQVGFDWIPHDDTTPSDLDWLTVFVIGEVPSPPRASTGNLQIPQMKNDPILLAGSHRFGRYFMRAELESGSGSNTWTIEPVSVLQVNYQDPRSSWIEYPFPPAMLLGDMNPPSFDETDLPHDLAFRIRREHPPLAFKFTRTGAGTNRLLVTTWSNY